MKNESNLNFCYCFDENYNVQAFSSMISLLDIVDEKINIFIIHNTSNIKNFLPNEIKNHSNLNTLKCFQFKDTSYDFPNIDDSHISEATFYRIFISNYIKDTEFLIYVDADTILLKNPISYIREEFSILNKSKNLISARTEYYYSDLTKEYVNNKNSYTSRLKIESNYFNAGFMLINLSMWEENNMQSKFIKKMLLLNKDLKQWDQDVLNATINGAYNELSSSVNTYDSEYSKYSHSNSQELNNIILLHYAGSNKPWLTSGAFSKGAAHYHLNFRKLYRNKYHITHKWKLASIKELTQSLVNKKFFLIDSKSSYIFEFIRSMVKFK